MKAVGIIPARYASSRYPGKPLVDIQGKSMIHRVYDQALKAKSLDEVVIATDDERVFEHAQELGLNVEMTSEEHQSGTDRCAEIAQKMEADVVVNIQGDEPFIDPEQIELLLGCFNNPDCEIATLVAPMANNDDIKDPNKVKCIMGHSGRAIYFSRTVIPYDRGGSRPTYYRHLGLYAYKHDVLLAISKLPQGRLELAESLEQLRWIENDYHIYTAITHHESPNIDTPEDLENLLRSMS